MRYGYNTDGSFSEQAEYMLHAHAYCKADCGRHPDVTRAEVDARRASRREVITHNLAYLEPDELAEIRQILGDAAWLGPEPRDHLLEDANPWPGEATWFIPGQPQQTAEPGAAERAWGGQLDAPPLPGKHRGGRVPWWRSWRRARGTR
jgi:hypothetical protein